MTLFVFSASDANLAHDESQTRHVLGAKVRVEKMDVGGTFHIGGNGTLWVNSTRKFLGSLKDVFMFNKSDI